MHPKLLYGITSACVLAIAAAASAQPNTEPTKVVVTPEQVLSINGRKLFPIGFTVPPPPDAKTPGGKLALEEFREAGATFIRTGPMRDIEEGKKYAAWDAEWAEREKQYMKAAARAGMYCAPFLKELAEIDAKHPEREERLRRVVRFFKGNPGMGVWKGADEPQWGKRPVPGLVRAYQIIHEEDPNHPVWIVHARAAPSTSCAPTTRRTTSAASMFIRWVIRRAVIWPRPIRIATSRLLATTRRKMLRVTDRAKAHLVYAANCFQRDGAAQTSAAFSDISAAAVHDLSGNHQRWLRGLVYYGGNLAPTLSERDRAYGWNWTYWEARAAADCRRGGRQRPARGSVVCGKLEAAGQSATRIAIELCVREVGRDVFVLACSRDPQKTAEVQFTGFAERRGRGRRALRIATKSYRERCFIHRLVRAVRCACLQI